jgi:hypothetical protein
MTTTQANAARAKQLLHLAADASKQLEESVRELVSMRAWDVLGYANLSEMWEAENGFKCPTYVKVLAVDALVAEGMRNQGRRPLGDRSGRIYTPVNTGHTNADVALMVGMPTEERAERGAGPHSNTVSSVRWQLREGITPDKVVLGKARPKARRIGKNQDELVNEGFNIVRRDADAIAEIARKGDVPKAEIYRQAVAEYLARYRASRPVTFSGAAS